MQNSTDRKPNAKPSGKRSIAKRGPGKPSEYHPKYCAMLIDHMKDGLSMEAFASKIGKHRDTLYTWIKAHPDFYQAHKQGVDASLLWWEQVLRGQAVGKIKGSAASAIFVMKNRFGWRDVQDLEVAGKNGAPIAFHDLTPEEEKKKAVAGLERLISALTR